MLLDPDAVWGRNLHNLKIGQLKSMLTRFENLRDRKLAVMAKHKPGTPYHTRAQCEADGLKERIEIVGKVLEEKGMKNDGR